MPLGLMRSLSVPPSSKRRRVVAPIAKPTALSCEPRRARLDNGYQREQEVQGFAHPPTMKTKGSVWRTSV
ncbi:conserved hypothetical protein [Uncinocarpus reesii 1704]|uniref:Uncharacterized protein n=1 Tax=Uncinocarpus reesii (strain UAMH 1704) TaxID=336963 RepID=C4JUA6_UNCRE|nr:uncharacterized protein UREG_06045 [Uncinocarpus reesii 1704]EEP81203.1 conserved hypothetical protein [Uncinocarpus reesii 1704]